MKILISASGSDGAINPTANVGNLLISHGQLN